MTTLPTSGSAPLTSTVIIVPTDQGVVFTATNAPPSGTYYPAGSVQHLFLTKMQDMQFQNDYICFLATDSALWAKKDIITYGAFATASDPNKGYGGGAILMGHGLNGSSDPPQIILTDNNYSELYIDYYGGRGNGNIRLGKAVTDSIIVNGRASDPSSPSDGEIWFRSDLSALRIKTGVRTCGLRIVPNGSGHSGMGGIPKITIGGQIHDLYLVETTDPSASPVRIKTTTGIKAVQLADFALIISSGANGSINGPSQVNYGDTPTYNIIPNTNYSIADVQVNGSSVGQVSSYTFPPVTSSGLTISASFVFSCQTCQTSCQSCNACQTTCELSCQAGCQVSCQNCQTCVTCQTSETCPSGYYECQSCETCQPCYSCQTACELACQNCQTGCQVSCQNCQTCVTCQTSETCPSGYYECQSCETCQPCVNCQGCQTTCEFACQTGCQVACQTTCELACQTGCQLSCQTCNTCQTTCELSCQTGCETEQQSTIFQDNFSSGNFNAWTSTTNNPTISNGKAVFSVPTGDGSQCYAAKEQLTIDSDSVFSVSATIRFNTIPTNGQGNSDIFFAAISDSTNASNAQVYALVDGSQHFGLWIGGYPNQIAVYDNTTVQANTDYTVTIQLDNANQVAKLIVNGQTTITHAYTNYSAFQNSNHVNILEGIMENYDWAAVQVTLDDVAVTGGTTTPPTEYTLTVNINGSGSVTKNPNQTTYTSGTSVQLTAVPGSGYQFVSWSGALSGSTNPASVTMDSNKTVTATFQQIQQSGTIFSDNFSSGTFDTWTATTNNPTVSNGAAVFTVTTGNGAYCFAEKDNLPISSSEVLSVTSTVSFNTVPSNGQGNSAIFFNEIADSTNPQSALAMASVDGSGHFGLWIGQYPNNIWVYDTTNVATNTSYTITVQLDNANQLVKLIVNGATTISHSYTAYSQFQNSSHVNLYAGIASNWDMTTVIVTADNFEVTSNSSSQTTYTITASAGTGGSISPTSGQVQAGGSQTFTMSPNSGYHLSDLTLNGTSVIAYVTNNQYTASNINTNITLSATFAQDQQQSTIFQDNFSSGNFNAWTSTTNSPTISNGKAVFSVPTGDGSECYAEKDQLSIDSNDVLSVTTNVSFNTVPNNGEGSSDIFFGAIADPSSGAVVYALLDGSQHFGLWLGDWPNQVVVYDNTAVQPDTNYSVTIQIDNTNQVVNLVVNGQTTITHAYTSYTQFQNSASINIAEGIIANYDWAAVQVKLDDVTVTRL